MRIPKDSATQLPAAGWRGQAAGLGSAGRSDRRGPLPDPGRLASQIEAGAFWEKRA